MPRAATTGGAAYLQDEFQRADVDAQGVARGEQNAHRVRHQLRLVRHLAGQVSRKHVLQERAPFDVLHTVFDLISEHALISGHPPVFCIKKKKKKLFYFFILILIIISSDFREGNTSLLYTGLMATRALTLRVHLLGQI